MSSNKNRGVIEIGYNPSCLDVTVYRILKNDVEISEVYSKKKLLTILLEHQLPNPIVKDIPGYKEVTMTEKKQLRQTIKKLLQEHRESNKNYYNNKFHFLQQGNDPLHHFRLELSD